MNKLCAERGEAGVPTDSFFKKKESLSLKQASAYCQCQLTLFVVHLCLRSLEERMLFMSLNQAGRTRAGAALCIMYYNYIHACIHTYRHTYSGCIKASWRLYACLKHAHRFAHERHYILYIDISRLLLRLYKALSLYYGSIKATLRLY